jgi:hypothetical protein
MLLADAPRFLTFEELRTELAKYCYRDGWEITIFQDPWESSCLYVVADVPDAYNPGKTVELRIRSIIPPIPSREYFAVWLCWRLSMIESHEARELFRDRSTGRPVFDPHDAVELGGKQHRRIESE